MSAPATEQRPWWEEGCYCPPGKCICGTPEDPFFIAPAGAATAERSKG